MAASGYVQIGIVANHQALVPGLRSAEREIGSFKSRLDAQGGLLGFKGQAKGIGKLFKEFGASELGHFAKTAAGAAAGLAEFGPAAIAIAGIGLIVNDITESWQKQEEQLAKVSEEYKSILHSSSMLSDLDKQRAESARFGGSLTSSEQRTGLGLATIEARRAEAAKPKTDEQVADAIRKEKMAQADKDFAPGTKWIGRWVAWMDTTTESERRAFKKRADALGRDAEIEAENQKRKEEEEKAAKAAKSAKTTTAKTSQEIAAEANANIAGKNLSGWAGGLDVNEAKSRGSFSQIRQAMFGGGDRQLELQRREIAVAEETRRILARMEEKMATAANVD